MLHNFEQEAAAARARHRELLREAASQRLARLGLPARTPLAHRGARLAGRLLVRLGARLLRFGRSEHAVLIEQALPPARSAALN